MVFKTRKVYVVLAAAAVAAFASLGAAYAAPPDRHTAGTESQNLATGLDDAISARTAPNATFDPNAYAAAFAAASQLGSTGGRWTEIGPYNYFTDDPNYADPAASNSGSGDRYVSGRITAMAATSRQTPTVVVAGGAGGGLWRTVDGGAHWTPVGDGNPTLSIGSLEVNEAAGCVFVAGSGEANTNADSYAGVGFLRSTDCGLTWTRVGPDELNGKIIWHVHSDPNVAGQMWAATSNGVYRTTDAGATWALAFRVNTTDFVGNQWTDVVAQPGTTTVVAADGWRNGDPNNGLYVSRDGGTTWALDANPNGWVPTAQQGRVTLAYSADGSELYAVDEDPTQLVDSSNGVYSALGGVFSAKNGDPAGPWNQVANASKLSASGSAEQVSASGKAMKGYQPGVQAWYNQFLAVDPADPQHVYLGLEEVYETQNGGSGWNTIAPYWNLTLSCFSYNPFEGTCNQNQAHSDQHAAAISGGTLWVGNDGGVYSRSLTNHAVGEWTDDNQTLGTLQFYSASAGRSRGGPTTYWGGLQDNGTAKFIPGQLAVQPFGGDGGTTYVNPGNGDQVITEYVYLSMSKSLDGGHTFTSIAPADPNPRFIAPFGPDRANPSTLVAGGEYVWTSNRGFATAASDWQKAYDTGAGHSITAIDSAAGTIWTAWCGPCNPHMTVAQTGNGFRRGLATNAGGTWHAVTLPADTNRYISSIWADPASGGHAYITLSGYSRNWIVGTTDPGTGHVWETRDGGATWTNLDGNGSLVDAPANTIISVHNRLVVGTDLGVFISSGPDGGTWQRLGSNLPAVVVDQLSLTPDGNILAATHGRGAWIIPTSGL